MIQELSEANHQLYAGMWHVGKQPTHVATPSFFLKSVSVVMTRYCSAARIINFDLTAISHLGLADGIARFD